MVFGKNLLERVLNGLASDLVYLLSIYSPLSENKGVDDGYTLHLLLCQPMFCELYERTIRLLAYNITLRRIRLHKKEHLVPLHRRRREL